MSLGSTAIPGRYSSATRWKIFIAAAVAINVLAFLLVRAIPRAPVQGGAAFDVALTVPLLYFLLIVRAGLQPAASVAPLLLLGMLRASYLVPSAALVRPALAASVELAVAALLVHRLRRGLNTANAQEDVPERLAAAAREIVPARRIAAVLASELAGFFYALSWRRKAHVPAGARAFSIHRESGIAALFGVLAGASLVEAALVHLVIARWSVAAAWLLTALSVYGALWLTAIARSFVLRPVLMEDQFLVVRTGILWSARIPRGTIVVAGSGVAPGKKPLTYPLCAPNVTLHLSQPVAAHGLYGMRREVCTVALQLDDRDAFLRALTHGD